MGGEADESLIISGDHSRSLSIFSHRGARNFAWYRLLEDVACDKLFARDLRDGWYNGQIGGLGQGPDDIRDTMRKLSQASTWSGALGASMGGYAAILFGCLSECDAALAFSPQTLLDPIFPLSPPKELPCVYPDLAPVVELAPNTKVSIVCGADDVIDLFYAAHIAHLPNVTVFIVESTDHLIAGWLHERKMLRPVIDMWMENGVHPILSPSALLEDKEMREALSIAVPAYLNSKFETAIPAFEAMLSLRPGWAGALNMLGQARLKIGDLHGSVGAFEAAIAINPNHSESLRYLGRALFRLKRHDEAIAKFRKAVDLAPDWAEAFYDMGDCFEAQNKIEDARLAFARSSELKPRWAMPSDRLKALSMKVA